MKIRVVVLSACIALAGCGDEEKPDPPAESAKVDARATEQTTAQPGRPDRPSDHEHIERYTIRITDAGFEPAYQRIKLADHVTWRNTGRLTHSVVADNQAGLSFVSGPIPPGTSFKKTLLTRVRTIDYYCRFHPRMRATVDVTE